MGERHPLEAVVNELEGVFGNCFVNLRQVGDRDYVESLVNTQPNRLGIAFRDALYRRTGGHPLFTVALLHDLQERGMLIRDEQGQWIEGPELNWEVLPARVEGVIRERIARLSKNSRDLLTLAAVEGETFTG